MQVVKVTQLIANLYAICVLFHNLLLIHTFMLQFILYV